GQGKGDRDTGGGEAEMVKEVAVHGVPGERRQHGPRPREEPAIRKPCRCLPGGEQNEQRSHPLRDCGRKPRHLSVSIPHAVEEGPRCKSGARTDQWGAADIGQQPIKPGRRLTLHYAPAAWYSI